METLKSRFKSVSPMKQVLVVGAIALVYLITAKFSLLLAFEGSKTSPVWPPAGISLAAMLLLGYRVWPSVFIGVFLANVLANTQMASAILTALGISIGSTLEPLAGLYLFRRFIGNDNALSRGREAFIFVIAGGLSCLIACFIGPLTICATGVAPWALFWEMSFTWWIGDVSGILVVTPMFLGWSERSKRQLPKYWFVEVISLLLVAALLVQLLYGNWINSRYSLSLIYLTIPLLVWITFRWGQQVSAIALAVLSTITILGISHSSGPFLSESLHISLLLLQGFVCIVAITIHMLSASLRERTTAIESFWTSEVKWRSYIKNSPYAVFVANREGRYIEVNPAASKITGYSELELLEMGIPGILAPESLEEGIQSFRKLASEGTINVESKYKHKNLGIRDWAVSAVRLAENRFLGFVEDITERKRLEHEHQKTQRLESLGLLAGGIAHDFNNILAMIFGYVEMAARKSKEEQTVSYLNKSLTAMDRARALTSQLLTFAKGGAPVQKIGRLFPFVQEAAQFALSGSNVNCRFEIPDDVWMSNHDQNQIGQVIDNIIINAQQSMPMGGTIVLTAKNIALEDKLPLTLPDGKYVRISIQDSGIGIPADMLPRIFDPFFSTKIKGHGLGLATCYSIVNRHGGCIDVVSEPGKGSTFHIYLPAADSSATPTRTDFAAVVRGSGTFLVMDDEKGILDITQAMLEELGYTVVSKTDGKTAVAFFADEVKANRSLAGIILDLTIPGGMGGKEAVKEIRKLCQETPVFVASGYAEDPVMSKPKEHGFTASICKPFKLDELTEMLDKHIKSKA